MSLMALEISVKKFPYEDIKFQVQRALAKKKDKMFVDHHKVKIKGMALTTFITYGATCYMCGIVGEHFRLERLRNTDPYHLTLFTAAKGNETEVQMTMDHIQPVSKGGKTKLTNLMPCCSICNGMKGNKT